MTDQYGIQAARPPVPADWYPDPWLPGGLRYWSGETWTAFAAAPSVQRPAPMGFDEAIKVCFSKFTTWQGRAGMAEYWWWFLFSQLYAFVLTALWVLGLVVALAPEGQANFGFWVWFGVGFIALLPLILPSISVSIRRLHDTDKSGANYWLFLIPYAGGIIQLIFMLQSGTPGPNHYGPVPGHRP